MGGTSSSPTPVPLSSLEPPPSPFTSNPWRITPAWNEDYESSLRKQIKQIQSGWKPTIVLVGPIGAGKSSFVNAILSVSRGYKVVFAETAYMKKSCTTRYDKCTDYSLIQNFRLGDCMGIEQGPEEGFNVADMVSLLKGHIKNGYEFNPRSPISPENKTHWRAYPTFKHQTHCVVFVVDANAMHSGISRSFVKKIREMQDAVKRLCVPCVLIMPKADVLCQEVCNDTTNMFRSVKVAEAVKTATKVFGIPIASIYPVTNYEDAFEISWKRNIPLLLAWRQITQYATDRIDYVNDNSDSDYFSS